MRPLRIRRLRIRRLRIRRLTRHRLKIRRPRIRPPPKVVDGTEPADAIESAEVPDDGDAAASAEPTPES